MADNENWLQITDDEVTAAALAAQVERQVAARRKMFGTDSPRFPSYGHIVPMPQPPDRGFAPDLYHHLHRLNEWPPVDLAPMLAGDTPAMRLPLLGRLWRLVRGQAHQLALFYVSRLAADNRQAHVHLVNVLNGLTRLAQAQQAEIAALRAEIAALRVGQNGS